MRLTFFLFVAISALFAPLWVTVIFGLLYAFWYSGYELLFLGACIDAQFGISGIGFAFWYTCTLTGAVILALTLRPYMNIHFKTT